MKKKLKTKVTVSKNGILVIDFMDYCIAHPEQRFWQALRNFSGYDKIGWYDEDKQRFNDTFYYEDLHPLQTRKAK